MFKCAFVFARFSFFVCAILAGMTSFAGDNLVPDASFDAPSPAWFSEEGKGGYFAGKELRADALEGRFVLDIQGWETGGSAVLSPAFDLDGDVYSGTLGARSFGATQDGAVELALFDEKGAIKLGTFGSLPMDGKGQWGRIEAKAVKLAPPAKRGRLGIVVKGKTQDGRVEVDLVGLFKGDSLGVVADNADWVAFEAEELATGKNWVSTGHFTGWYSGAPLGMKMLSGSDAVAEAENTPARKGVDVRHAGPHRLWLRLLRLGADNAASYRVAIRQDGAEVGAKDIYDGDEQLGKVVNSWVWVGVDVALKAGTAEIVLTRPPSGASWIARKVDFCLLTNLLDYKPDASDFRPQGFVRFTNLSEGQPPYCAWWFAHRLAGPVYYLVPGVLSRGGLSGSYYAPGDKDKWLSAGESSPWVNISRFLQPGGNNVTVTATRGSHVEGMVTNGFVGTVEFAVGPERKLVRKFDINQNAPVVRFTLPCDFEKDAAEVMSGADHVARAEKALAECAAPKGSVAKHLDISAILALGTSADDPELIDREINVLRQLGFNGLFDLVTAPAHAETFAVEHGLEQHFGLRADALLCLDQCFSRPDVEKMRAVYRQKAAELGTILPKVERMKLADEPGGTSYEHIIGCEACRSGFVAWLKEKGENPTSLGVGSWDEVKPVGYDDRSKRPELFYHTGFFRLKLWADLVKASVKCKREFLPDNVRTFVNYSPPGSEYLTWESRGADPFMAQRDGGLELGWTEDWIGYSGSPQQMSTFYAHLRAAGRGQPLGGYMVGVVSANLQRLKYYTMLAAGVRHVNVYNYGPSYASCDSWSRIYEVYPIVRTVQHELGVIDEPLLGAARRKTDIAICYNRTANIWGGQTSVYEQDNRYIQWALAHAGFDADYLPEEDIESGDLAKYRVLYLDGPQLRKASAERIKTWVEQGGALVGMAGAGSRDEFDRPLPTLNNVFGAKSDSLELEQDAGRPKYETRGLKKLDTVKFDGGSGLPPATVPVVCVHENIVPQGKAVIVALDDRMRPAAVFNECGEGRALRLAALPGLAYFHEAVKDKDYDIESYAPVKYPLEIRNVIAWAAEKAGAFRVGTTDLPATEIVRYDKKDCSVVFLLNYANTPDVEATFALSDADRFDQCQSASGTPVQMKKLENGKLQITLKLNSADAVVLERKP
jgi:hypothetical protein